MSAIDHMLFALAQLEMADTAIRPGDLPNVVSANLHVALFYLMAAIEAGTNPVKELAEIESAP